MTHALAALLLAAAGTTPQTKPAPAIQRSASARDASPRPLGTAADLQALCKALTPAERIRTKGDALERGQAETRHDAERDAAMEARYEVMIPAGKLPFAPYDGPERRLALSEPAQLPVAGGVARLWPTEERDLAVEADAAQARRILDAQRAGRLSLRLAFDLPDDTTCGSDPRQKTFTIAVEPVDWSWLDGQAVVVRGGAGADRPAASAAQGARPRVEVGEPIAGPAEAKRAVLSRAPELEACYLMALQKDPAVDGVVVVELGAPSLSIAADSTGTPELAACVERTLAALTAPAGSGRVAVPIRFELVAPKGSTRASTTAPNP
jgi:hypothetical protein